VVADPSQAEDCDQARFLGSVGMDAYPDQSTSLDIAPAFGVGRMRYVTKDWQSFNMLNVPGGDEAYLRSNPPPLD